MARPEVIKTALGERLRAVRRHLGDSDRVEFARALGVTDRTLGNHERGDSVPDTTVLAAYRSQFGVNVNWLATGEGEMFIDPPTPPEPPRPVALHPRALQQVTYLVASIYKESGMAPSADNISLEVANLYNELTGLVPDVADEEMVHAALYGQLRLALKRRLSEKVADPASSKRSA